MPTIQNWQLTLEADDVLRAQGGEPAAIRSRRPLFVELAERALAEGLPLLQPLMQYRQLTVEKVTHQRLLLSGGASINNSFLYEHLAPAAQVVVIACTIGSDLETRARQIMAVDPLYGLAVDGVGTAAVAELSNAACHYFEEQAALAGLTTTIPFNPGMEKWPLLEGQKQVFAHLNSEESGIQLLPSGVMSPQKSLSLIIGIGAEFSNSGVPCDYCGVRHRCRHRRLS
jgi:hypothetical protein